MTTARKAPRSSATTNSQTVTHLFCHDGHMGFQTTAGHVLRWSRGKVLTCERCGAKETITEPVALATFQAAHAESETCPATGRRTA